MARDPPGTRSPAFASIGLSRGRRLFPTYLQAHTLSTSSVQRLGWLVYRLSATNRRCLQVGYSSTARGSRKGSGVRRVRLACSAQQNQSLAQERRARTVRSDISPLIPYGSPFAINRRSRCGSVRGSPVVSSHFSFGAAPQVGHRIASIFLGLSFFLTSHIMRWDFRRLLVNFEQSHIFVPSNQMRSASSCSSRVRLTGSSSSLRSSATTCQSRRGGGLTILLEFALTGHTFA